MEMHLYTLHAKPGRDLEAIGDGFDWFAFLVPPLWAIWHGLWAMLAIYLALLVLVAAITPLGVLPAMSGLALIAGFEGAELRRWERGFWGWKEAAVVEARTPEGAEELFLNRKTA